MLKLAQLQQHGRSIDRSQDKNTCLENTKQQQKRLQSEEQSMPRLLARPKE
jgi:hypothetical protein